jgi:hypothetical protein
MSTLQDQSRPVKAERTPKAETTAELTAKERALCHAFAELAASRLYLAVKAGQSPEGPVRGLPSRGKLLATTEAAYDEARSRMLAERETPEPTASDAFWAAEMARHEDYGDALDQMAESDHEATLDALHEIGE